MSVRVSPISKVASILIVVIGAFVFLTGVAGGLDANTVAGLVFVVLGLSLYILLFRFSRKVDRELREAAAG